MLSTMQKRLRDEYDIMNEEVVFRIELANNGMLCYESLRELELMDGLYDVDSVYEDYDLMDWERQGGERLWHRFTLL